MNVVAKVLYPETWREAAAERFERESKQWPGLHHPHVLPVLEAGRDEKSGLYYTIRAASDGRDLEQVLGDRGALDPVAAVRIGLQAAHALEAAHRLGLLHRGVRPDRIVLERVRGEELFAKVRDYGTARPALASGEPAATNPQALLDSPDYAAPEQLRDAEGIDERADVWGLGATLYAMLCGSPPFGHFEEVADVVTAILTDDVPHLQDRAPWVSAELTRVVHRALAHAPDKRFATCEEFANALRAFSNGDELLLESAVTTVSSATRSQLAARADLSIDSGATAAPPLDDGGDELALIGKKLDGKYEVTRLLGRGGMGAVYEVRAPSGEKLAAKVISRGMAGDNPAALTRFAREAKAASTIASPNVCRTLDAGSDDRLGLPYIIMEFLDGTDLSAVLKSRGALDPQVAVRLALQGASGVAAAHARHVVHRDIKPANLFLQIDEKTRSVTVKVCDFGVAKRKRSEDGQSKHSHYSLTRTGGMIGSPMYMAPEQARNAKSVDERADVWSLSVVLWEALSGLRLWGHQTSLGELIVAICTEPIRRLEEVAPWVPKDLARVVHKGLERDLQQRTQNMHALIGALELFAGGSDRVNADQLTGIDETRRAELLRHKADARPASGARAEPRSSNEARGSNPTVSLVSETSSSGGRGWIVGLVLVLLAGAAALFLRR
jgi:serine/threonine protein kinase